MSEHYWLQSEHLDHRQVSGNIVLTKDGVGQRKRGCHKVPSQLTHGQPSPQNPVSAGEMIHPARSFHLDVCHDKQIGHAVSSRACSQGSSAKRSGPAKPCRSCGKENRPHSPFTRVMTHELAHDEAEELSRRYENYAAEKERQQQPLRFKLTKSARHKLSKARQKSVDLEDKQTKAWTMKKFQSVKSFFEQERILAKCASSPQTTQAPRCQREEKAAAVPTLNWPRKEEADQSVSRPVLNWPPREESESYLTLDSRSSATPSSIRVSANAKCVGSSVSATKPHGSVLSLEQPSASHVSLNPPGSRLSVNAPAEDAKYGSTTPSGDHVSKLSASPPVCNTSAVDAPVAGASVTKLATKVRPHSAGTYGSEIKRVPLRPTSACLHNGSGSINRNATACGSTSVPLSVALPRPTSACLHNGSGLINRSATACGSTSVPLSVALPPAPGVLARPATAAKQRPTDACADQLSRREDFEMRQSYCRPATVTLTASSTPSRGNSCPAATSSHIESHGSSTTNTRRPSGCSGTERSVSASRRHRGRKLLRSTICW